MRTGLFAIKLTITRSGYDGCHASSYSPRNYS